MNRARRTLRLEWDLLTTSHKERQIPEDKEGNSLLESVENLDEALDNEETRRMILGLVDDLPPEQRMTVLFYYYDEMTVKQIAEAMDTSDGTVKSRLNDARRSIAESVAGAGEILEETTEPSDSFLDRLPH